MTTHETNGDDGVYHIVCHDCPTEFLATEGSKAEQRLSEHRSATGHDVDFAALGGTGTELVEGE